MTKKNTERQIDPALAVADPARSKQRHLTVAESAAALSVMLPEIQNMELKLTNYAAQHGSVTVARLVNRARSLVAREFTLSDVSVEILNIPTGRPFITQAYAPVTINA